MSRSQAGHGRRAPPASRSRHAERVLSAMPTAASGRPRWRRGPPRPRGSRAERAFGQPRSSPVTGRTLSPRTLRSPRGRGCGAGASPPSHPGCSGMPSAPRPRLWRGSPGPRLNVLRAGTRRTALSQHCLCGARVDKTLADRVHQCLECGLVCDRDLLSAALGCFVCLVDPSDRSTAWVDYGLSRNASSIPGLKEALSESNASPERHRPRRRDGRASASRRARGFCSTKCRAGHVCNTG